MRRSFNLGLSTRIIRGDAPYAPAHYKGGNKPGFGITYLKKAVFVVEFAIVFVGAGSRGIFSIINNIYRKHFLQQKSAIETEIFPLFNRTSKYKSSKLDRHY
ncbi:MAG: hypothetical protein HC789_22300 [Microcoleus sp. CSU_2_2]|nr:hypothetical protein [Microcoleus sp. CSU_2_2]